ncbi:MAG: ThuA domain-containing protein [Lachnospirales bacterium]
MEKIRVTVWNEYIHEVEYEEVRKIYPKGIHGCIQDFLEKSGYETKGATLNMKEHGLTEEVLEQTDVLIWWGHMAHDKVEDSIVERVHEYIVKKGMGLIVLHSGHGSKIFRKLMGTESGQLKWREDGEKEIIWTVNPAHEIVDGINEKIIIPEEEMYGEFFNIPAPDEQIFISWFEGGEIFRSGCCFYRGTGKVFYFRPGHETFPVYHMEEIQKVITNAVKWARKNKNNDIIFGNVEPTYVFNKKNEYLGIQGLHENK